MSVFESADPEPLLAGIRENLGELAGAMGIDVVAVSPAELVATMPVAGNRQPYGLLHGGANAVLAETAGSILSALLGPSGTYPVGIELSCTHHRSARSGRVRATCTPISVGRTLATMSISISDEDERLCCTARLTCLFRREA
jgi:uncharacterized protein (TIGR00369 family)